MVTLDPNSRASWDVYHSTGGLTITSWTIYIFKNGERRIDGVNIQVYDRPSTYYHISFNVDDEDKALWTCFALPSGGSTPYSQVFQVRTPYTEQNVAEIRSQMELGGKMKEVRANAWFQNR